MRSQIAQRENERRSVYCHDTQGIALPVKRLDWTVLGCFQLRTHTVAFHGCRNCFTIGTSSGTKSIFLNIDSDKLHIVYSCVDPHDVS